MYGWTHCSYHVRLFRGIHGNFSCSVNWDTYVTSSTHSKICSDVQIFILEASNDPFVSRLTGHAFSLPSQPLKSDVNSRSILPKYKSEVHIKWWRHSKPRPELELFWLKGLKEHYKYETHIRGNPLSQATKRHLNSYTVKNDGKWDGELSHLSVFGWAISSRFRVQCFRFSVAYVVFVSSALTTA